MVMISTRFLTSGFGRLERVGVDGGLTGYDKWDFCIVCVVRVEV